MLNGAVIRLIKEYFPYEIDTIKKCGEGVDAVAYRVNDKVIVKVPKSEWSQTKVKTEIETLEFMQTLELPLKTPIALDKIDTKCDKIPFFSVIIKIDGRALNRNFFDALSEKCKDRIAEQVAQFLFGIHNSKVTNYNIPVVDMLTKYQKDYALVCDNLSKTFSDTINYELEKMYHRLFHFYTVNVAHNALVHGDLSIDAMFYNEDDEKLEGIIDFGDSKITDVETDFIYLLEGLEDYPKEFGEKIYAIYGGKNLEVIEKKIIIDHAYWPIELLMRALAQNDISKVQKMVKKLNKSKTFIEEIQRI